MKLPLILSFVYGALVYAISTPGGCTNAACQYVQDLADYCQDTPTESQNSSDCLCTQRFAVNLQRCIAGYVCAWDGTNTSVPQVCVALYCPGMVDQSLIDECPNALISSSSINWNTASATGSAGLQPITVSQSTSGGTSQSQAASGTGASTINGTDTATRTGTESIPTSTSSDGRSRFDAMQIGRGLAVNLGLTVFTW